MEGESKMPSILGMINVMYGGIFVLLSFLSLISFFSTKFTPVVMNEEVETMLEIAKELKMDPIVKIYSISSGVLAIFSYSLLFIGGVYLIRRAYSGLTISRISAILILLTLLIGILFNIFYYMPHFISIAEGYGVDNPEMYISKIKIGMYAGVCFLFYPVILLILTFSRKLRESLNR